MSRLRIYDDDAPRAARVDTSEAKEIVERLSAIDVPFERWAADRVLAPDAAPEEVLTAYHDSVERLMRSRGYRSADVIRLRPDSPQKDLLRKKFLSEHTHSEDEVRFFVEGAGNFFVHVQRKVYSMLCERGDLLGVPMGMRHWFDMGESPRFTCVRLFTRLEGWEAHYSGDGIADRFPRFGE